MRITPVVQDGSMSIQIISTTCGRTRSTSSISPGRLLHIIILVARETIVVAGVSICHMVSTCLVLGVSFTTTTATTS